MESKQNDPVIDEVREVRHRISEKFGHDPARLVAHYIQIQEQYRDRLIGVAKTAGTADRVVSDAEA
ncbi:MAG: hypothetical protein EXR98_21135 [Gemmataceae bacterium]|nr:hypothetical protein [Gemmataceae bacterium]